MGRVIFLLSMFIFSFSHVLVHAFPEALYELISDEKQIIIWSDEQICVPVVMAKKAIAVISDYIEKNSDQAKVIIHCISQGYQKRSRTKVSKHEHEANYAISSLLLDTIASKFENSSNNILLVHESSDNECIAYMVNACLSSRDKDIIIFMSSSIVQQFIEELRQSGFTSRLISV